MIRNLKTLGLALVAITAMSAMFASAASATLVFHSESAPVEFTGSQAEENVFHAGGSTVRCKKATFTGSSATTTPTHITVTPSYSECTAFGFASAHVNASECEYTIGSNGVSHSTPTTYLTGYIQVQKHNATPNACKVPITPTFFGSSVCTVTVSPNPAVQYKVDLENQGAGTTRDVLVRATAEGLPYAETGGGCGLSPASGNTGNYTGTVTVTGENPVTKAHIGIWVTD